MAIEAQASGLAVVGLDVDERRVSALCAGRSHVTDVSDEQLAAAVGRGLAFTTDPACLAATSTAVICVPTPLTDEHGPDLSAVRAAAEVLAPNVRRGMLVVLESTTYPGTTDEFLRPILEQGSGLVAGQDFNLAYSPERIDPGNATWTLKNTPKVVGGYTEACTAAAATFYGKVVDQVVVTRGTREAEMAKLLENTYRHVNIALVNEMAIFSDELGIDLWAVIDAASTKPFGFQRFSPGPGVGGHCIPIDPNYLSYKVRTLGYPFRFVELAQEINSRMPAYVAARVQRLLNDHSKPVKGSRVVLLGVTYKADVADERESPARPLGRRLRELGADLSYHDPFVPRWRLDETSLSCVPDAVATVRGCDIAVLLQPHAAYDLEALGAAAPLLLDTRGVMHGETVESL
jgi:nucleotide sugar dehydrogenase